MSDAFAVAAKAFEFLRRSDTRDPEILGLLVQVTMLFSQLAVQLGRNSEARSAAMETLEACFCADPNVMQAELLGAEIEKLKYYAELPID